MIKLLCKKIIGVVMIFSFLVLESFNFCANTFAEEIVTSDELSVKGFQIRDNQQETTEEIKQEQEKFGVSFRIIGQAPTVGSIIIANNTSYTIENIGILYVLDSNNKGIDSNGIYSGDVYSDEKYTVLDMNSSLLDSNKNVIGYKGLNKSSEDANITYGFLATEDGIIKKVLTNTSYCQTLTKMDELIGNTIHTRAFAIGKNSEGNKNIIYSSKILSVSIAEIANYLYVNNMCTNAYAHDFLFDRILNGKEGNSENISILEQVGNSFYRDTKIQYGWNGSLYLPDKE